MRSHLNWMKKWRKHLIGVCLLVLAMGLVGCSDRSSSAGPVSLSSKGSKRFAKEIVEVSPPASIQSLRRELDGYQPQVKIISPKPGEVLEDTTVSVQFQVNDLPLFKDEAWGLGPHLDVVLDNQKYQAVYDARQPVTFKGLEPGTHTIRAFASRPWHESFKNSGAYAQVSFNVFTDTANAAPDTNQPLLTYSRPEGSYGAEPILLDFFLTDAPLHVLARESDDDEIEDWSIRGTVNGQTFTVDTWEPIYLTGFVPGLNWVKLELIDTNGKVIQGPFNSTARLIDYEPGGEDTLSKLIRGELSVDAMMELVDPNYEREPEAIEPEIIESVSPEGDGVTEGRIKDSEPIEASSVLTESRHTDLGVSASSSSEPGEQALGVRDDGATDTDAVDESERSANLTQESSLEEIQSEVNSDPVSLQSSDDDLIAIDGDASESLDLDERAVFGNSTPVTSASDRSSKRDDYGEVPSRGLSPVNESVSLPDTVDESEPMDAELVEPEMSIETYIDSAMDSPIEDGVDVMPEEFEKSDENMEGVAERLIHSQEQVANEEQLVNEEQTVNEEQLTNEPSSQPPLIRPIEPYRVFQI